VTIAGNDLAWYGAALALAICGFVVQLSWNSVRESGGGLLFLFLGLGVATVRLLLQRLEKIGDKLDAAVPPYQDDGRSSLLVEELWNEAVGSHHERIQSLRDGTVTIHDQQTAVDFFAKATRAARHSLAAVDHIALTQWFRNPRLKECLETQMELAARGTIRVQRIRFVTPNQIDDAGDRQLLREFVRMHDEAGAVLLLCPEDNARTLDTGFFPRTGMVMTDIDARPTCVIARLSDTGYLETASLYLRALAPVRTLHKDFERLCREIDTRGWDELLRRRLAQYPDMSERPPAVDEELRFSPLGPRARKK
jgi:hypothetical protein